MRYVIVLFFALYLSTHSLNAQLPVSGKPLQPRIVTDTNCTIIAYSPLYYRIFKDATPATLSGQELQLVDSIYTYSKNDHRGELIKNANYKRQYMPVINSKGEKEVWVNCFCWNYGTDWRNNVLEVFDGGSCYFNLKINLTKKEYYDLSINGNS